MIRCLMGVRFSEYVPSWGSVGKFHTIEVYACGLQDSADLDAAIARARRLSAPERHLLVEVQQFCAICAVSGIKPGCRRKACEACAGRGVTPITSYSLRALS